MFTLLSRGLVTVVALLGLLAPLHTGNSAVAKGCEKVQGQITLQPVDPARCSSQLGCGEGTIKGGIKGSFYVVSTSMLQSVDTPTTYVVFATSDTTYTTKDGILYSKDAATLSATGEYAEIITITGGTEGYSGATGTLTATGAATATGGSGTYGGEICVPKP